MGFRLPRVSSRTLRTAAKGAAVATAVGVTGAAVAGAIPGTEDFSAGVGDVFSSAGTVVTAGLNGVAGSLNGIAALAGNLPLLLAGGAVVGALVLFRR